MRSLSTYQTYPKQEAEQEKKTCLGTARMQGVSATYTCTYLVDEVAAEVAVPLFGFVDLT